MLPYIDMEATGKRINSLRIKQGMSVADIQRHFGFYTPQPVYKWLNGKSLPTVDNLVILADLLKCKVDDILVVIRETEK